jgi:hypothetical protein
MVKRSIILLLSILFVLVITGCEGVPDHGIRESYGIVKDYTGLDGCGFVIELADGEKLEPFYIDSSFVLVDGQHVWVRYSVLEDHATICMVGSPARIYSIHEIGCDPITQAGIDFPLASLPDDPFELDTAFITVDCLDITLWHSGGCKDHVFTLVELPNWCGTPPVPPPQLLLCHNANNDACEAYLQEAVSFDLTGLQVQDSTSVTFVLLLNIQGSTCSKTFTYNY